MKNVYVRCSKFYVWRDNKGLPNFSEQYITPCYNVAITLVSRCCKLCIVDNDLRVKLKSINNARNLK